MLDIMAYIKATQAKPYAKAPAKMSGGDKPLWNADMDMWLNLPKAKNNPTYKCSDAVVAKGEINK